MSKTEKKIEKKIILMYFQVKNILKNNIYHTLKDALRVYLLLHHDCAFFLNQFFLFFRLIIFELF